MDVALALSGVLSLRTGIVVALVLEALFAVVLVVEAAAFRRAYRATRQRGAGRRTGLVAGAEAVWPPVLLRLVRAEAGVIRALWWAVRRRSAVGPDDVPLPYAGRFGLVLGAVTALGVLETAVVHVLLPWEIARWVLLVVSFYGLVRVLGSGLSLFQHPHVLRDGELVLRSGHLHPIAVPLAGLVSARRSTESEHGRTVVRNGDRLVLSVMGDTDVELRFDPPVPVAGQDEPVARVAFWADDPQAVVRLLRDRAVPAGR
ncbi:hypothetical protein [Geodermatophilus obscurus]|uniref:Uncharacterized protein n=1 Tax=Geodermatophilus obscurus (strain ATCC 25078 / DSM 43160 / JCM 3152 / CCUG 61914 / KCC A-0152 / KCTC 9177 / NBRC 13315 / NRRL B-3577 / G-20) TaxID=526225 RepID=D2S699_GEOOG|nr:hypothetical protein [Geodermatophilus obscurus]ADB73316.1 conserved hypothetical protein [Geodermatophilus obscurus DSM 43160]